MGDFNRFSIDPADPELKKLLLALADEQCFSLRLQIIEALNLCQKLSHNATFMNQFSAAGAAWFERCFNRYWNMSPGQR
jgi:hypothetical protein